jgi:hypothetical protein
VEIFRLASVIRTEASFLPDDSCRLTDPFERTERTWSSVAAWASDWISEWRADEWGDAKEFLAVACDDAVPGVVGALVALAEAADGDNDLIGLVGAGPLENLVSHSGNGLRVLPEVEQAARQSPAFRAALRRVALGDDVPLPVATRLGKLGAMAPEQS